MTREALESVSAAPIATSLLFRALSSAGLSAVPEDATAFRAFVEGALRTELTRSLGAGAVTLVLDRLKDALGQSSSSRASGVVRREPGEASPRATRPATGRGSDPAPRPRSPVPVRREEAQRPARALRPAAVTMPAMPKVTRPPTCILVNSRDPALALEIDREIASRAPVLTVSSPAELARAVPRAGDRLVVVIDTALPGIDVSTFIGLVPILPPSARVVLWGADEDTRIRLASRFPTASNWIASGDSRTPGLFVVSL